MMAKRKKKKTKEDENAKDGQNVHISTREKNLA